MDVDVQIQIILRCADNSVFETAVNHLRSFGADFNLSPRVAALGRTIDVDAPSAALGRAKSFSDDRRQARSVAESIDQLRCMLIKRAVGRANNNAWLSRPCRDRCRKYALLMAFICLVS